MHLIAASLLVTTEFVTKHSWWPEWYELAFGIPATLIVGGMLWKFAGPPLKKSMAERTNRFQRELDAAAEAHRGAQAAAAALAKDVGDIQSERARILAEADTTAAQVLSDGRARLQAEATELEAKAEADIATSRSRMIAEVQAHVASVSAAAVEHVVTGSLDDATQQRLIEDFIAKVGHR